MNWSPCERMRAVRNVMLTKMRLVTPRNPLPGPIGSRRLRRLASSSNMQSCSAQFAAPVDVRNQVEVHYISDLLQPQRPQASVCLPHSESPAEQGAHGVAD